MIHGPAYNSSSRQGEGYFRKDSTAVSSNKVEEKNTKSENREKYQSTNKQTEIASKIET